MPAAACFTEDFLYFYVALLFDKGWTDRNAHCCVNIVDEKFLWLKFDELPSRDVAMATNFVVP